MTQVNIDEAKTHFSRLIEAVTAGESVTIARAGTPVARLVPYGREKNEQRLGFLVGHGTVPDDFDDLAAGGVGALLGVDSPTPPPLSGALSDRGRRPSSP